MYFVISILILIIGRLWGWRISRLFLYRDPLPWCIIFCAVHGMATAILITQMLSAFHPPLWAKIVFGYCLGAYVSIPNFGLMDESTLTDAEKPRHLLVHLVPFSVYIFSSVLLYFFAQYVNRPL